MGASQGGIDLVLKTPLGRNKVVRLGLFLGRIWIQACGIMRIN